VNKNIQGVLQGYIGCTRVYRVCKGIQGVLKHTGCTMGYRVYKGIQGVLKVGYTRLYRV